jgi:hypothetical protein
MEKVLEPQNLKSAWKQVKANKGSSGVDGVSIDEYPEIGRKKWPKTRKGLIERNYVPSPVLRAARFHPCSGISYWMTWTRSWSVVAIGFAGMLMTLGYLLKQKPKLSV